MSDKKQSRINRIYVDTHLVGEKKQSSIEWLIEILKGQPYDGKEFVFCGVIGSGLIEQAKAMHKEEIEKAWNERAVLTKPNHYAINSNTGQEYYNETFGE